MRSEIAKIGKNTALFDRGNHKISLKLFINDVHLVRGGGGINKDISFKQKY